MLPFKMRVYQAVAEAKKPMNADDIMEELEVEYRGEKQFNRKRIEHYLDAITAVGMIREHDLKFNETGEVTIEYVPTQLGIERLKYIPK